MVAHTQLQTRPPGGQHDMAAWQVYVQTVENCFLEIRGRGVHWSELDRARATAWFELGLPASATVRVLHARVEAWRFRHGANAKLPMHLGWYEPAVLEQAKHLRQLGDAVHDPLLGAAEVTPSVADLVAELSGLLAATDHRVVSHVYTKAFAWLDDALQGADPDAALDEEVPPADAPDLADLVAKCRSRMNKLLVSALDDTARTALTQHLTDHALPAGTLSHKAAKQREERLTERWLAGHFGHRVPTLTGWRDPRDP